ncbi:MAG: D-alanyl-D-alanine carboxypeptidase [Syntrophomonadaceae bacterium]|nr:D-alanyl-D-alanine carboxypeptidase [Syntrophomonadaceae bacterium]
MQPLIGLMLLSLLMVLWLTPHKVVWAQDLGGFNLPNLRLTAEAAVLIEGSTGQVLWAKNAYQRRPPASTTKILTTLVALERGNQEDPVIMGASVQQAGGRTLGLRPGQVYPLGELIEAALIYSANDACVAIGEHFGEEGILFLQWMNQKALTLGAYHTTYYNFNGMPHKNHRSCAFDLGIMARYALNHPEFARVVKSQFATITPHAATDNKPGYTYSIKNTNALLWSYPGADGVKTGTTQAAGACLVASATREKRQLVAVVLKSGNRFGEAARLLDFGFNHFTLVGQALPGEVVGLVPVACGEVASIEVVVEENMGITVPVSQMEQIETRIVLDKPITAPVPAGTRVGEIVLMHQGRVLQRSPLLSGQAVAPAEPLWKIW